MRTVCAALMCVCILAVGIGSATAAETIVMPYGDPGFTATWASFEGRAVTTIRCPLTLDGTFSEAAMEAVVGTPVATVNQARFGTCASGSARVVESSLPWQVKFDGFTGILPNITSVRLKVVNAAIATEFGGVNCVLRTSETAPLRWNVALTSYEAVSTEFDPTTGIRLEGGGFCSFAGTARVSGRSGPLRTALGAKTFTMVQGPAANGPWVVSLGDSFISGEAGRWAANTHSLSRDRIDRGRARAYFDNPGRMGELIQGCHRVQHVAEINFGLHGGPQGRSLACSGATTTSQMWQGLFKPGFDLVNPNSQTNQLRAFARERLERNQPVRMVVVSIGGNDFHFGDIIAACVTSYLSGIVSYCKDDPAVTRYIEAAEINANRAAIRQAVRNVRTAMNTAGYADTQFTIMVQNYPAVLATGGSIGYFEDWERWNHGGCPFWNQDASWAYFNVLPAINGAIWSAIEGLEFTNVRRLDLSSSLQGHRLCERDAYHLEERGFNWWSFPGVARVAEWVNMVRTVDLGDLKRVESIHPNSWGYLAHRGCLRAAYNNGGVRSGWCVPTPGDQNQVGEPWMTFTPVP